jgi:hypothetical protein
VSTNAARANLTPEEIEERRALFARLDREFGAAIIDHPSKKRQPLGLAPAGGPDANEEEYDPDGDPQNSRGSRLAREIVATATNNLSEAVLARPPTGHELWESLEMLLSVSMDGDDAVYACVKKLRVQIDEMKAAHRNEIAELKVASERERATIAELRAAIAELSAKVGEVSFVSERLRIDKRGPPGHQGARGADGREGARGERGERGPQGPAGLAVAAWEPLIDHFQIIPTYASGERGVPIPLRPFFDHYHQSVTDDDE